jgi:hypothetical protein
MLMAMRRASRMLNPASTFFGHGRGLRAVACGAFFSSVPGGNRLSKYQPPFLSVGMSIPVVARQ